VLTYREHRALADAAQLSERERSVLTYLLMGRSLGDIALILGISPRTVKFHQANVLEKLGADSRADLVRLIT
jgi:DNA-binding CsgD family transcriptional regulator